MPKDVLKEKVIHVNNTGNGSIVVNIVSPPVVTPKKIKKSSKK